MKKIFAVFMVLTLLLGSGVMAHAESSFPDVDDDAPYAEAVSFLADIGIFVGDNAGNFNPDHAVTRAEMATLIFRMLGENADASSDQVFSDVGKDHWAYGFVTKVAQLGFISGYGNGKFGPNDVVTYEQALTMVVRAAGLGDEAESMGGYPDGFIGVAAENGFINDITAQKGEHMLRWQIAMILYSVMMGGSET